MTKNKPIQENHGSHFQTNMTLLVRLNLRAVSWSKAQDVLLAFATTCFLVACGGGGGGTGTGTTPIAPKALEALSAVVELDGKVVNALEPVDTRVTFRFAFNSTLGTSGIGADQVQLSDGTRTYPVNTVIAGTTLTVVPSGNLHTSLNYTLTVKSGAISADGSVLKSDYDLKFRTVVAVFETKQLVPEDRLVGGGSDTRILIKDINNDGRPDLVKLGRLYSTDGRDNGYTLSIFIQNAAGGFDKLQKLEYLVSRGGQSYYFKGLVVQDIDGDSKPEVLVPEMTYGGGATGIRIFKGGTDGKYAAHDFISSPNVESLQAMDVDGDGLMDLVGSLGPISFGGTGAFQVLMNTGGGFTKLSPVVLPQGAYEFGLSDLDMDGKRELIVNRVYADVGPTKSELLVFSQISPGTFSKNNVLTNEAAGLCSVVDYCYDMRIVDVNKDGKSKFIFLGQHYVDPNVKDYAITFSRQPTGGWARDSQLPLGFGNFYGKTYAINDMDGDGIPDLLALAAGEFGIFKGALDSSWVFSNRLPIPVRDTMYPTNVVVGDIDSDGLPDIIFDSGNYGIVVARQVNFRRRP